MSLSKNNFYSEYPLDKIFKDFVHILTMVNEDIVTALRNAVERGETLQNAMNMLISSGYPPSEVQDASKFVGFAPVSSTNQNITGEKNVLIKTSQVQPAAPSPQKLPPQSQLQQVQQFSYQNQRYPAAQQLPQRIASPNEIKAEISSRPFPAMQNIPIVQKPMQQYPSYPMPGRNLPQAQPIKGMQQNIQPQVSEEAPKKPSYTKEIILLIILLLLIGILITTIVFRDKILTFFS